VIVFVRPQLLLLALPWIAFWIWFARRQRRSCEWIWQRVHERFRDRFTVYRRETLARRMAVLLILGLLLVLAAAGPAVRGETEVRELASRVVLLLDGSASMLADDVPIADGTETRFERGRKIAAELGERLQGSRFALVVFSGVRPSTRRWVPPAFTPSTGAAVRASPPRSTRCCTSSSPAVAICKRFCCPTVSNRSTSRSTSRRAAGRPRRGRSAGPHGRHRQPRRAVAPDL